MTSIPYMGVGDWLAFASFGTSGYLLRRLTWRSIRLYFISLGIVIGPHLLLRLIRALAHEILQKFGMKAWNPVEGAGQFNVDAAARKAGEDKHAIGMKARDAARKAFLASSTAASKDTSVTEDIRKNLEELLASSAVTEDTSATEDIRKNLEELLASSAVTEDTSVTEDVRKNLEELMAFLASSAVTEDTSVTEDVRQEDTSVTEGVRQVGEDTSVTRQVAEEDTSLSSSCEVEREVPMSSSGTDV